MPTIADLNAAHARGDAAEARRITLRLFPQAKATKVRLTERQAEVAMRSVKTSRVMVVS